MKMSENIDTDSDSELPGGWEERVNLEGKVYYANHEKQATQWEHPSTGKRLKVSGELPFGWEQKVTENGMIYYMDHNKKRTTYTDPRLAFAVEDKRDAETVSWKQHKPKFDGNSTARMVLQGRDLTEQYVIVTGATSGIGLETARSLASHGAHVVMACRNIQKAEEAKILILKDCSSARVEIMKCDLASLQSVVDFCRNYISQSWPLHGLILNAGIFDAPYTKTVDGFESTFQVNHLSHFLMVRCLQELLKKSAPSRVVVVSSESHRFSKITATNLQDTLLVSESGYGGLSAYNNSKLCNVLFSTELNGRLYKHGVTSNALHPGNMVYTGLQNTRYIWRVLFFLARPFTKNLAQSAATSVYVATHSDLQYMGGLYFNNCWQCIPSNSANDTKMMSALWQLSEQCIRTFYEDFKSTQI